VEDVVPRRYPAEFRRKVLDLVAAGRPVARVAGDLQISAQVIYTWRRPREAFGTVSAARMDWEPMTAAVGWALRPAAVLTRAGSSACGLAKVPSSRQAAK
jgi:transposase-like protein